MISANSGLTIAVALSSAAGSSAESRTPRSPETVVIRSGQASLQALFWRPGGRGPFPTVLLNHGSGHPEKIVKRPGPAERQAYVLGPVFARQGYQLLYLFRRGVGLSQEVGENTTQLMNAQGAAHGQLARNAVQMQLLDGRELDDVRAALTYLRKSSSVDRRNIAVIGHSFGGSLSLVLAENEPGLRAVVVFGAASYSWDRSPELRARLLAAAGGAAAPIFFIHAANDYSTSPGRALDARLQELRKRHRLKIYPPVGRSAAEGHDMLHLAVDQWEPDVFAFLDEYMRN
jgi:dienelactone hydrolase